MFLKSFLIYSVLLAPPLAAEEPLTLDFVLSQVEKNNPELAKAQAEADRMSAMATAAYAWEPPKISLEYMGAPDFDWPNYSVRRLALSQDLPFPGTTFLKGRAATHAGRRGRAMARKAVEDQLFEARKAFYSLLGAAHAIGALEKASSALGEFSKVSKARGGFGRLDRMGQFMDSMIRSEAAQMEAMLPHWRNERRMAEGMLNRLMGREPSRGLGDPVMESRAISRLSRSTDEEAWKAAEKGNADLEEARHHLQHSRNERNAAYLGWLPELMLEGAVEEDRSGMRMGSLMVGASIPWLWFWRQGGEASAASAQLRHSEAALESMRLMVKEEAWRANGELNAVLDQLEVYEEKVIPAAAQSLEQAVSGYKAGVLGAQEALMAVMGYWEIHEKYAGLVAQAGGARAAMQRLTAQWTAKKMEDMRHD